MINPLEMFSHMTAAAETDNDQDDIKFIFTIRSIIITLSLTHAQSSTS